MVLASKILKVVNLREVLRTNVELGAQALLGWNLVKEDMEAQIVETEAYTWDDPGCHAYRKERMKNMAMYGQAGTSYVYFTYGNHWMLNVVADEDGTPGAVLIRAAMPVQGIDEFRKNRPLITKDRDLLSGPGRLAKGFGIDSRHNALDLLDPVGEIKLVWSGEKPVIGVTKRIGIATGKGDELLRRYVDTRLIKWVKQNRLNEALLGDISSVD
jgi:DNA-3-methyladenine glycosylase